MKELKLIRKEEAFWIAVCGQTFFRLGGKQYIPLSRNYKMCNFTNAFKICGWI